MRVTRALRLWSFALAAGVLVMAGCGDSGPGEPTGPPETSTLTCTDGGTTQPCTLPLTGAETVTITFTASECGARGTKVRVTAPVQQELMTDACYAATGQSWTFEAPFATEELSFEVEALSFPNPATLGVVGATSPWTVRFEDGGDNDRDDLIFTVTTTAAP